MAIEFFDHDFLRERIIDLGQEPFLLVNQFLPLREIVFPEQLLVDTMNSGSLGKDLRVGMQPSREKSRPACCSKDRHSTRDKCGRFWARQGSNDARSQAVRFDMPQSISAI